MKDLNSSYGAYAADGKLSPGVMHLVADGEAVYLGSKEAAFRIILLDSADGLGVH